MQNNSKKPIKEKIVQSTDDKQDKVVLSKALRNNLTRRKDAKKKPQT